MHLGNSIICPVTGIPMIIAMGAAAVWAFKKAKSDFKKENILPATALTSLVFCLQMINFAIPTTGSSGHIVGGVLLAALLGPYVGFLSICAILLVQCLLFADGGLTALGCNIFNMGFIACFAVYPFIYKPLAENKKTTVAAVLSAIAALQLGSIAVVAESALSGSTSANIGLFASFMQSIHLGIGIIEGIVSAVIIAIAHRTQYSKIFSYSICAASLLLAGVISQFASSKPDGLEWSLINISDSFVAQTQGQIYAISEIIQAKTALLASVPSIPANISGLIIIAAVSAILCTAMIKKETVNINNN